MTGATLSHYRIVSELGRGGMGIVYLAEDTKLDRQVAIKVLPASALSSADDRARFYREAKAAAALNHPNIAQIYQIDEAVPEGGSGEEPRPFIAMEYIDGETLDERIKKGPLKLKDAVRLATQIAGALGEAHEKDIVHRDVKASNVMLTSKGDAKVLDFGLALTAASTKLTRMGSTLGTVAYMSPEQARGEEVDRRTDLWALGVVLYEMVAGRNPFGGDYEQAVVYSILNAEPEPLTAVRTGVPMQLEWIVDKCLAKEAGARYQTTADLIVDLKNLNLKSPTGRTSALSAQHSTSSMQMPVGGDLTHATPDPGRRHPLMWVLIPLALLVGFALHWAVGAVTAPNPTPAPLTRVQMSFDDMFGVGFPKLSPTREWLLFRGIALDGRRGLWLRNMATGSIRYVEDSESGTAREAAFSPDGSRIAFTESANGGVFTVVVPSGIPERLTESGRFAFWEDDRTIVMSDDQFEGGDPFRVGLDGGDPEPIRIRNPQLPDGYTNVLKTHIPGTDLAFGHQLERLKNGNQGPGAPNLFSLDTGSGELTIIESNAINPEYIGRGLLMYQIRDDDGRLVVRPFDPATGAFTGRPIDVLPDGELVSWSNYGVTDDGDFFYLSASNLASSGTQSLYLVDISAGTVREVSVPLPSETSPEGPRFSSTGSAFTFAAVGFDRGLVAEGHIFTYDIEQSIHYQHTFGQKNRSPVFGPEDAFVYYTTIHDTSGSVMRTPTDRSSGGIPDVLLKDVVEPILSPDGDWMAVMRVPGRTPSGLAMLTMPTLSEAWSDTTHHVTVDMDFSPDGRYLAMTIYPPDEPSGFIEIRSIDGSERFSIPEGNAETPRWSHDGRYLYYYSNSIVRRIRVRTTPTFNVTGEAEDVLTAPGVAGFDIAPDGNLLVVSAPTVEIRKGTVATPVLIWLQNYAAHVEEEYD